MSFRFRKSVQLFPGVRLNFSPSGLSTTIGVRGAGVTIGARGTYANVGLPGTGLSHRARLDRPVGRQRPSDAAHPSRPGWVHPPETAPHSPGYPPRSEAPWLGPYERIGSASVEYLTSPGLQALRDLVDEVADRRGDLEREIAQLRSAIRRLKQLEAICRIFLLRLLTFALARAVERKRMVAEATRADHQETLAATAFELDFVIDDEVAREFGGLERAYQRVRRSAEIWDVTGRAAIEDWVRARTIARQSVEREPVCLDLAQAPFVHSRWQALRFGNVNGENLYLYPGFVMVHRPGAGFALIEIDELNLESFHVRFNEDQAVPADARVVGHTWLKANKDNTPDRRFRDNRQIPVVLYGWLEFRSGGLHEAYMVSNADAVAEFATAFDRYRRNLAAFAARGGIVATDGDAPLIEPPSAASERAEGGVPAATPRRFGLGFPVVDIAAAAILAWVVVVGLPRGTTVQTTEPAASVSEAPAQVEPGTGGLVAPVQAEPEAGASVAPAQADPPPAVAEPPVPLLGVLAAGEDRYWVTADRLNRRTCPSTACGIVGQLFFREAATIYEQKNSWARISTYYDASCNNGRSEYVESGNNQCKSENGIVDGKFAEWVSVQFLSQDRPPDPAAEAKVTEALVAQSDDYRIYKAAFVRAAEDLISTGQCSAADFKEMGGWMKSISHKDQPIYFTYCGGLTVANRLYLNAETGKIFH
jgi:Protein of unknown function (DUF4236)